MPRSFIAFLLIAGFGILFVGCSPPEPEKSFEEFTFTEGDMERAQQVIGTNDTLSERNDISPSLTLSGVALDAAQTPVLDAEAQRKFDAVRAGMTEGENIYRVTNTFLNVRQAMSVSSAQVAQLNEGDSLIVIDIPNASWAHVRLLSGEEGYVAFRYISKVVTEDKLAEEKAKFAGKYFVDFEFLNVRKEASSQAEKVGELVGYSIVTPVHVGDDWTRVTVDGKEGYVATTYLKPFEPLFLVRQEHYDIPILQYRATDAGSIDALVGHMAALKGAGVNIITLLGFYETVIAQEEKDTRVPPNTVILTISGVTGQNANDISNTLAQADVRATLFIQTKELGLSGITEKMALTLLANGHDLQSAGHTGDDLRALTDSQIEVELGQSRKLLEELTRKEVYAVAYPLGGVNERVMRKAAEAGYLFGVGLVPNTELDRSGFLRLPSITIGASLSGEDVLSLLE